MARCLSRYLPTNGFFTEIYKIVKKVPPGKVVTYGQIAEALGTRDARRVGQALHANRDSQTPCHRVVNKDGRLAPGYAFGGDQKQREKLIKEGVIFKDEMHVDLKKCRMILR